MSLCQSSRKRSLRKNVLLNSHLSIYHALTNPDLDDHDPLPRGDPSVSRLPAPTSPNPPMTPKKMPDTVETATDADTAVLEFSQPRGSVDPTPRQIAPAISPSLSPVSFPISLEVTPPPGNAVSPDYALIDQGLWQAIEESMKMKKVSSSILSSTTASDKDIPQNRTHQSLHQLQRLTLHRHTDVPPADYSVNPLFASSFMMVEQNLQSALGGIPTSVSLHLADQPPNTLSRPNDSSLTPHVMVFETDEEDGNDGDDFDVEIVNPGESCGVSTTTTFIMPKMLLSTNNSSNESSNVNASKPGLDRFNVAIVSLKYLEETAQLIKSLSFLKNSDPRLNIYHINLLSWKHDDSLVRKANLVIIINDGSANFVHFLTLVFATMPQSKLPKLTIINMVSTNYFVNLLELIQLWKPHQMWKTTSLSNDRIFDCLHTFISTEVSEKTNKSNSSWEFGKNTNSHAESGILCTSMVYSQSLQLSKTSPLSAKPNYKHLEHQMKSEMISCSHYSDPLQLSSKLQLVCSLLNKLSLEYSNSPKEKGLDPVNDDDNSLWMVCSFTMGVGLGIGLATSAATVLTYLLSDPSASSDSAVPLSTAENSASPHESSYNYLDIPVIREFIGFITSSNWNYWFQMFSSDLRVMSSLVMECVGGGIMKVCDLLLVF